MPNFLICFEEHVNCVCILLYLACVHFVLQTVASFFGKYISVEMSSTDEEQLTHDYNFVVIGGGIAGVTCVETVSFIQYNGLCYYVVLFKKIILFSYALSRIFVNKAI